MENEEKINKIVEYSLQNLPQSLDFIVEEIKGNTAQGNKEMVQFWLKVVDTLYPKLKPAEKEVIKEQLDRIKKEYML